MKLILCLLACACLCACCAGVPPAPTCAQADIPIALGDSAEVSLAAVQLLETCLPSRGKGMMVLCDQVAIERLMAAINGKEVPK